MHKSDRCVREEQASANDGRDILPSAFRHHLAWGRTKRHPYTICHGLIVHLGHLPFHLVDEMANLRWFSRVWTIQEVARARNPIVMCGRDTIPFEQFISGLFRVVSDHPSYEEHQISEAIKRTTVHCNIRAALQSRSQTYQYTLDLLKVMRGIRDCGAAEPKDKIFAIHDLFWEIGLDFPPPNYALSLGTVYWEATKAILKATSSIQFLYFATGFENPALDAPSWVPDFSDTDPPWPIDDSSFEAALFSQNESWLIDDGHLLDLHGLLLDTISDSSSTQILDFRPVSNKLDIDEIFEEPAMSFLQRFVHTLQVWALMARELRTYPNGVSWDIAFVSTVTCSPRFSYKTSRDYCSQCCEIILWNIPDVGAVLLDLEQRLSETSFETSKYKD